MVDLEGRRDTRDLGTPSSPPVVSREIRWLRFDDPAVERVFREEHVRRCLPIYRFLFAFVLVFQVGLLLEGVFLEDIGLSEPRLWARAAFGVAQGVLGLYLIQRPTFVRWGERYMVVQVIVIGLMLIALFGADQLFFTRINTYLISTVILPRLRVRMAASAAGILIAAFAVRAGLALPDPGEILPPRLAIILVTATLLIVGAYLLEQAERRDFVLTRLLTAERAKSERLLLNVLPPAIAQRLKEESGQISDGFAEVTVLYADIVSFTPTSARWGPGETVRVLNEVVSCFDELAGRHGVEKIKTIGDGYLVAGGVPEPRADHALAVVAMGLDMLSAVGGFRWPDGEALAVRIGIASGPAVAGVIGTRKFTYDLWGDTVSTAARMQQHGVAGAIQMTDATHDLVRHRYVGTSRDVLIKGKGRMRTWVLDATSAKVNGKPRRRVAGTTRPRRAAAK
jgi:class 3 adenylate cyclase